MSETACPFCNPARKIVAENEHAFAIHDLYPVSQGHALVIPRRHAETIDDLSDEEYSACWMLVREVLRKVSELSSADGFNIGVNIGEAAGQTVGHAHIHVIPRFKGDVANPRGGVRHVIPGKGDY